MDFIFLPRKRMEAVKKRRSLGIRKEIPTEQLDEQVEEVGNLSLRTHPRIQSKLGRQSIWVV